MAEGRAKIIIDADAAKVIAEAIKAGAAIEKVAKKTKGIGDQFTAAITKVGLFKMAVMAAGRAIDDAAGKAEKFSRAGGASNLSAANSFSALGAKNIAGSVDKFRNLKGANTDQQNESFLSTLVSNNEGARNKLSAEDAQAAAEAFAGGGELVFGAGGKELSDNLKNGMSVTDAIKSSVRKRPGLSGLALDPSNPIMQELAQRSSERAANLVVEKGQQAGGMQLRRGQVETALADAEISTGSSLRGLAQSLPIVGNTVDLVRGKNTDRADAAVIETAAELRKLNANTNRPALSPGAERGP